MVRAMARLALSIFAAALAACGAAGAPGATTPGSDAEAPPDCVALRATAEERRAALDACRVATPPPEWSQREAFDWLEAQIGARLDGARHGETAPASAADMQQIAERVWSLVDEISEEQRDPALMARIEDASEQLMHPHDAEGRTQALAEMGGALGVLRERLEPSPQADACADQGRASAEAWMTSQVACGDGAD